LIVDYAGVFRNLERALAIYGAGGGAGGGEHPVEDKQALVAALRGVIEEAKTVCRDRGGIELQPIKDADGFERIRLLDDAVDALVAMEEQKKRYLDLAANVLRLYRAMLPDPAARELQPDCVLISVLAEKIRALSPIPDISEVMRQVEELLDRSIDAEGYVIDPQGTYGKALVNLSSIDFEALRKKFEQGRKHTEIERLKGAVSRQLQRMVRLNRSRIDFLERFQEMIDAYNSGGVNTEDFFRRLMEFAKSLTEEEQRSVGEQLSDEELAVFDILTKPDMTLTDAERNQVKKVARELLETLKQEKLVLDWRKRQQSRAQVRVSIETVLDHGLPPIYLPPIYQQKSEALYQHVYDSYFGVGQSIYASTS
jgi:type I restriction enzyme R subunit